MPKLTVKRRSSDDAMEGKPEIRGESEGSRQRRHEEGRFTAAEIQEQWIDQFGHLGYSMELPIVSGLWPTEQLTQRQVDALGVAAEDLNEFKRAEAAGEEFDPNWRDR